MRFSNIIYGMCRNHEDGGRRCPSHTNPVRKALASAVRTLAVWQRRINTSQTEAELDHAIERFTVAVQSVEERSGWDPAWTSVPPPTRISEFSDEQLSAMPADDLERHHGELSLDPLVQRAIEAEWARRDAAETARLADEESQLREIWELQLAPETVASMSAARLSECWHDVASYPDLQARISQELSRRAEAEESDPWGHGDAAEDDPWGHGIHADDGDGAMVELSAADREELEWAYQNLSADKYLEIERQAITDPSLRSAKADIQKRPGGTVAEKRAALRQRYSEYQFERYINAEAYCRGQMLNQRGEAAKVDPLSLLSGNPKRMRAYASDEFQSFIGSVGGHVSFELFEILNAPSGHHTYAAHNNERFDNVAFA